MLKRVLFILMALAMLSFAGAQNVTPLAKIGEVGPSVCAWKDANGQPCDETLRRCAPGCPCYYTKEDGSCGSPQEAAVEIEQRGYTFPESRQIHDSIFNCLKDSGPFPEERAANMIERAEEITSKGSTLSNIGGTCTIQDTSIDAGRVWNAIRDERTGCYGGCDYDDPGCSAACDAKVDSKVREAKAANNDAFMDWATVSLKSLQKKETAKPESQQPDDTSLTGRLRTLEMKTKPVTPEVAWDIEGKKIDPQALKGGLSKSIPSATVGVSWNEITPDSVASIAFPDGLPVRRALMVAGEQVAKGTESYVTMIDGSTPRLLGTGVPEPEPRRYELKDYIKFDTVLQKEEKHPFKEALFEIAVSTVVTPEFYDSVKMLRWNQKAEAWDILPTEKITGCQAGNCNIVAKSPGTSVFAIVVEREMVNESIEPADEGGIPPAVAGLVGVGAIAFFVIGSLATIAIVVIGLVWLVRRLGKGKSK